MRHPLQHLRGNAIRALRSQGLQVDVLGEDMQSKLVEFQEKKGNSMSNGNASS